MNWKAVGYCTITCQTHSRNCVKIGETSRLSPARWPLLGGEREVGEREEEGEEEGGGDDGRRGGGEKGGGGGRREGERYITSNCYNTGVVMP